MRYQQLKLYETLLSGSSDRARSLMSNQSFLRPLLDLLNQFAKRTAATTLAPTEGSNGGQPPFSPPMSPTVPPPSLNKQESIQVHFISGHPWGPRVAWTSQKLELRKQVRFLKTQHQGFCQLFNRVLGPLRLARHTSDGVLISLYSVSNAQGKPMALERRSVSSKSLSRVRGGVEVVAGRNYRE